MQCAMIDSAGPNSGRSPTMRAGRPLAILNANIPTIPAPSTISCARLGDGAGADQGGYATAPAAHRAARKARGVRRAAAAGGACGRTGRRGFSSIPSRSQWSKTFWMAATAGPAFELLAGDNLSSALTTSRGRGAARPVVVDVLRVIRSHLADRVGELIRRLDAFADSQRRRAAAFRLRALRADRSEP